MEDSTYPPGWDEDRVRRVMTGPLPQKSVEAGSTPRLAEAEDRILEEQMRTSLAGRLFDPRRGVGVARRSRRAPVVGA